MILGARLGNNRRRIICSQGRYNMRVPDQVSECVVFVGRVVRKGTRIERKPRGTAFLVAVKLEEDSDTEALYLVTARHVALQLSRGEEWFIRYNDLRGERADVDVPNSAARWVYHPTEAESVDAAVLPLGFLEGDFDSLGMKYRVVPADWFAAGDVIAGRNIGAGDMVFLTGLFTKMTGKQANIPIVRTGNVAMIPSEKVPNVKIEGWTGEAEMYLIEARSIGGISGSPVFVRETIHLNARVGEELRGVQAQMPGAYFLLGLVHGHWDLESDNISEASSAEDADGGSGVNIGIALVVPAGKIREILNHPDLIAGRAEMAASGRSGQGSPTPD